MGGAGGEISPRYRRRKAPDINLTAAAVTLRDQMNWAPL